LFSISQGWCEGTFLAETGLVLLTEILANGLVIFRLFVLWNRSRMAMNCLTVAFVLAQGVFVTLFILMGRTFRSSIVLYSVGANNICGTTERPLTAIMACIPGLVFDIYAGLLFYVNALDRPRGVDDHMLPLLYSDGIIFLLLHISMRIFGLVFMATSPEFLFVYAFPVTYSLAVIINSRMFLKSQDLERLNRLRSAYPYHSNLKFFIDEEAYELQNSDVV